MKIKKTKKKKVLVQEGGPHKGNLLTHTHTRLAKSKFQKSGILEKKSGVYQERFSSKSGEKSGGFLQVFKSYYKIFTT
jgi:hypothetical protein